MQRLFIQLSLLGVFLLAVGCTANQDHQDERLRPIPGHAHNDYEHDEPLKEAIRRGYMSIEIDVHLIRDTLWVTHDRPESTQGLPTIQELYLDPLLAHVRQHKGHVYPPGAHDSADSTRSNSSPQLYLMVDAKTEAIATYEALKTALIPYEEMIRIVRDGAEETHKPIKVFLSGNRPIELMLSETVLPIAIDGRPSDLSQQIPPSVMPVVSQHYTQFFNWSGRGEVDRVELERFRDHVAEAHRQGKKVRLWATPDNETLWSFLLDEGADLINTDRLEAFESYYRERD